jgi:hypothetical protein
MFQTRDCYVQYCNNSLFVFSVGGTSSSVRSNNCTSTMATVSLRCNRPKQLYNRLVRCHLLRCYILYVELLVRYILRTDIRIVEDPTTNL